RRTLSVPVRPRVDLSESIHAYWGTRVAQHMRDTYLGVPLLKFPEDLRVYEDILWDTQTNVVIEIGSHSGGSALWFRDRLRTFEAYGRISNPCVISIDLDIEPARQAVAAVDTTFALLRLIEGDVLDESLPYLVETYLPPHAACLVVDDSAHTY